MLRARRTSSSFSYKPRNYRHIYASGVAGTDYFPLAYSTSEVVVNYEIFLLMMTVFVETICVPHTFFCLPSINS